MVEALDNSQADQSAKDSVVVFVLGTTGVGKSKLALDLAKHDSLFGSGVHGEIINADSMQIYSGNLNGAMTARPSPQDEALVPHHCYACIDMVESPDSSNFNVQKYRQRALEAISDVLNRGNVPIVCGGTNYYIESLLFSDDPSKSSDPEPKFTFDHQAFITAFDVYCKQKSAEIGDAKFINLLSSFRENIPIDNKQEIEDTFESSICHELLTIVDPTMATYLHTNDKRKIVNALFKTLK